MTGFTIDLSDKTAVVTGASSGIGAAIAHHMAAAGADTLAVGRDSARLDEVCRSADGRVTPLSVDLRGEDSPSRIVEAALETYGGLDILVHSAGLFHVAPFAKTTDRELDEQWDVNVRAPFRLTREALPHLSSGSSVIFVSSIMGAAGGDSCSAYCATKGAVESLTNALAVELAHAGVRFNCIAPGAVETPMNEAYRKDDGFYAAFRDFAPARRWGTVDDIAPAAVFLAGEAAGFIHGARVAIDGGWVAR